MVSQQNIDIIEAIKKSDLSQYRNLYNLYQMMLNVYAENEEDVDYCLKISKFIKQYAPVRHMETGDNEFQDLYYKAILFEAQNHIFDSFLIYLEKNRDPEDRYYLPRRKQLQELGLIDAMQKLIDDEIDILSISMPPGTGKAQPLYSKVLTPDGFVRMGDIHVGDKVISGENRVCNVIGVFPQGKKKIYELTFDDGSKCRCSDEHLWKVQSRDDRNKKRFGEKGRYRILELKDMLNSITTEKGKRANYSIDYVDEIDFKNRNLELDPYVMGVLLGDGSISSMNCGFTSADEQVITEVAERISKTDMVSYVSDYGYRIKKRDNSIRTKEGYMVPSDTKKALIKYGVYGTTSDTKFIPKEYLYSCKEDRKDLLRGLLDTDGYTYGNGIEYTTVSEQLCQDVMELVHSLGGYASFTTKIGSYQKDNVKVVCKKVYRVCIQFASKMDNVFRLDRKVYRPKREVIKRFIKNAEYIGEEECQCIMVDDPSHLYITDDYIITHNTTMGEMFAAAWGGWFPKKCNLFSSHSGHVTRMFYDALQNIITNQEYTWHEIFPNVPVESMNAKEETINLGKFKNFKTWTMRAIGASQTGVTRCEGILYCDDLCSGIEEALSKIRLDKLWTKYTADLKSRKKKKCKEIHIATRWSVWDVIGRIKQIYEKNPRALFIAVPDIDPTTHESNFDYDYDVGFDVEYFEDIEKSLDDITYKCLYKNEPVEREGLLYDPDRLRRYYGNVLPEKEPDAILGICDTKDTGTDFNALGVFYQYGTDYYLHDVVFQSIDPYLLDDINAKCLVRNNVQIAEFESNKEGSRTADKVQEKVKALGGKCCITKKFTTQNKETKIIVNSPWVIEHVLFKHQDDYDVKSDYGQFMSWLCAYSQLAKNPHDDAPDMVAMLAVRESGGTVGTATAAARLW